MCISTHSSLYFYLTTTIYYVTLPKTQTVYPNTGLYGLFYLNEYLIFQPLLRFPKQAFSVNYQIYLC